MTRWNFNSLITLSASGRQQTLRRRSWRCHVFTKRDIKVLRYKDACSFLSAGVLWGLRLHLCIRWRVRVTARFTTRTSSLSRSSLSSMKSNRWQVTTGSCTHEEQYSCSLTWIKPSSMIDDQWTYQSLFKGNCAWSHGERDITCVLNCFPVVELETCFHIFSHITEMNHQTLDLLQVLIFFHVQGDTVFIGSNRYRSQQTLIYDRDTKMNFPIIY